MAKELNELNVPPISGIIKTPLGSVSYDLKKYVQKSNNEVCVISGIIKDEDGDISRDLDHSSYCNN